MWIIAGLGNPGKKYENTRHNMGFLALDILAEKHGIKVEKARFKSLSGEGIIGREKVLLLKPQTYMNNSGEALREAAAYYKQDMERLLVIYDDIDLTAGSIRIRKSGSAGTHNGMRSVIYHLQEDGFPRIRIGIGRSGAMDLVDYVTGGVRGQERELLEEAIAKAAAAAECMVTEGVDIAMNRFNSRRKKEEEKEEQGKAE